MAIKLALRVAEWRQFRGLDQEQLARLADITRPRLSDIERSKAEPKGKTLQRIATALDCTVSQLYDEPGNVVHKFNSSHCGCDAGVMVSVEDEDMVVACRECGALFNLDPTEDDADV